MTKTWLTVQYVSAGAIGLLILLQSRPAPALVAPLVKDAPPQVAKGQQSAQKEQTDKRQPAAEDDGSLAAFAEFERLMAMKPPAADSKERKIAKEIARKFGETYANLKHLSMEAEITEIPKYKVATVKATMRPGFYTMKASFDGQLLYEQTFDHGKVTEHKLPYNGVPDQRASYEANKPEQSHGPLDVRLNEGVQFHMTCNIGCFFITWLGPHCDTILLIQQRLGEGWRIGAETIDGFPCWVVFYPFPNDLPVAMKFYIDKESFLLRNWVQFNAFDEDQDGKESKWIRFLHYYDIHVKSDEATTKPVAK